jgi:hypothetical protein
MVQQAVKALSDEWFELYWRGDMPQLEQLTWHVLNISYSSCFSRSVFVNCVGTSPFAGCALMFVQSVVCVTHWLVERCWVCCGRADELKLLHAAIPHLLLDVLLVFRDGHYSQETLALYPEVGTGTASCCNEHLSSTQQFTQCQRH